MTTTIYELQKRIDLSSRWHHVGYFREENEAFLEQFLPIGFQSTVDWKIVKHNGFLNPDHPERAILIGIEEVQLGRTSFFI